MEQEAQAWASHLQGSVHTSSAHAPLKRFSCSSRDATLLGVYATGPGVQRCNDITVVWVRHRSISPAPAAANLLSWGRPPAGLMLTQVGTQVAASGCNCSSRSRLASGTPRLLQLSMSLQIRSRFLRLHTVVNAKHHSRHAEKTENFFMSGQMNI